MQQDGQLSCHGNNGPFLPALAAALGQLQTPAPQIAVPHESEVVSCVRANKVLLESGSHFLTHADFGCRDGVHKAWIVVDVGSKDEARNVLPPVYRRQATIVQLSKFGLKELDDLIKLHEGR